MKKILILMLVALMVGKPLMVFATTDLHIEDIWYEDIDGTTVELHRYHNHFDYTPAGSATSQLLCGIASEVAMSEAEVETALNANSLGAEILALSNLEFFDFYTDTPIDGSSAWIDVSTVINAKNMEGYECMVYLDGEPCFTTKVIVVEPLPTPTQIPTPEPSEEADVEEGSHPPVDEQHIEEIVVEEESKITPTPTPAPTATPSAPTPTAKPTPELTLPPTEIKHTPINPVGNGLDHSAMSIPATVGLCAETLATLAVGVSLISDFRIIKFCKRKVGGQL